MLKKRLTLICGHYGSGKTNIAVNLAQKLRQTNDRVALADLDIVNPYFRAEDSRKQLEQNGIALICSPFANSNVDFPALPQEMYALTDDKNLKAVIDVGGDERGALALGRLSEKIVAEADYAMYLAVNRYRPLTPDADAVAEVAAEIEYACRIPFTGIINNSNLGRETTAQTVLDSCEFALECAKKMQLPLVATTVEQRLFSALDSNIPNLFPLTVQSILNQTEGDSYND